MNARSAFLGAALAALLIGAAIPARAAYEVAWSFRDSVAACPAGDSVVAGHPSRLRVVATVTRTTGGPPVPVAGLPPESLWVSCMTLSGNVVINDQAGRAFADDSTDAAGTARFTLVSFSGCGTVQLGLWLDGVSFGTASASVRSVDGNADGEVTAGDAPCDLDYDGVAGPSDTALLPDHFDHSHRNAFFGTLVRRTNLCENCADESPNTLGESTVSWSPDGRRLSFTVHIPPAGDCVVFTMPSDPAEGDAMDQFTFPPTGIHDYDPAWSPLGTEIAFGRADNTIWVKGIPGVSPDTALRMVSRHNDGTASERGDITPSFSPNGTWIAFSRKNSEPEHWHVWRTPANGDTTQRVQLTFDTSGDDFYPQWSTDGQWIVFARIVGGQHSLWRVPAAGGSAEPVLMASGDVMAVTPAFSPDGAVLMAGVGDTLDLTVHTLESSLGGLTLPTNRTVGSYESFSLAENFPVLSPRMSPDGTRLALRTLQLFAARRNMSLPPVITSVAGQPLVPATPYVDVTADPGVPLSVSVAGHDPEGDPLTWHAYFLRFGMTFDAASHVLSWTPANGDAGTVTNVRFQVTTPSGGLAYAIARITVSGTASVDPSGPFGRFVLGPIQPNPAGGASTIRFEIPAAGAVELDVYDLLGRRIRAFAPGVLPAGPHFVTWDGLDDSGARVAPSLYLCRLRSGDRRAEQKIVRIGR